MPLREWITCLAPPSDTEMCQSKDKKKAQDKLQVDTMLREAQEQLDTKNRELSQLRIRYSLVVSLYAHHPFTCAASP